MQKFTYSIVNALFSFIILSIPYLAVSYFICYIVTGLHITEISFSKWSVVSCIYILSAYLYIGATNNSFIVYEDKIEIKNNLPFFRKDKIIFFTNIKSALFRHEWTETAGKNIKPSTIKYIITQLVLPFIFPSDYKWLKITAEGEYKFFCFGIEMDYYENEGKPVFEEMFIKLAEKGIDVKWTDTSDMYYTHRTKNNKNKKV